MKKCPFCAEEIQDAAIVCKHCGRDLKVGASQVQLVTPKEKQKTGCFTWVVLVFVTVFLLFLVGYCASVMNPTPPASSTASSGQPEPDEPCRVDAPASWRAAAQNWCQGGVFTRVAVSTDANSLSVLLQFSQKTQRTWVTGKYTVLNRFRQITDEMVEKTDTNVAFSLFDTSGQLAGGCVRKRGDRESTCNAR